MNEDIDWGQFSIGDLVLIGPKDGLASDGFIFKVNPLYQSGSLIAIIVGKREANPKSHCDFFYKVHFCDEDCPDDRWVFADEITLIQ